MGRLKAIFIVLAMATIVVTSMTMDAFARGEARFELRAGDIVTGWEGSIQKPQASIFHQRSASATDLENFELDWPVTAAGIEMGPTVGDAEVDDLVDMGGSASANVLPFGAVNLAFPTLHEDATQTADAAETGFFTANWCYMADTSTANRGNVPIGFSPATLHPLKSNKMMGSEFLWPYMIPKASAADGSLMLDTGSLAIGNSASNAGSVVPGLPSFDITGDIFKYAVSNATRPINNTTGKAGNVTTGTGNVTKPANNTSTQSQSSRTGYGQRKPRVNPGATTAEIKNMTAMQRIWRNAFIGSTMHKAYEGPTEYPTWIDPFNNGRGVFNQPDFKKVIGIALNKTKQGEHIAPVLWDL